MYYTQHLQPTPPHPLLFDVLSNHFAIVIRCAKTGLIRKSVFDAVICSFFRFV